MPLFQKSVLHKYLKAQEQNILDEAYKKFVDYFHDPERQQNIRDSKEEQFQEGFLRELFVKILGYTLNPEPNFNLTTEFKNEKGAKKTDGAILKEGKALAVIELKGTDTQDLDKVSQQAFQYKHSHSDCVYVITSNFEKLRFFIHHAVEYLEFNLFTLAKDEFAKLWLCLQVDNLLGNVPLKAKEESIVVEENITKKFYKNYATFKTELWQNICKNNPQQDQLFLFKKTQKLLDRFLFIFFAEDSGLLPPNSISRMVDRYKKLIELDAQKPLYDIFKQYFGYINKGRKGKTQQDNIFAYNGGLFLPDEILDDFIIDDDFLKKHVLKLTSYDFQSEVDVNILGHIFENSLNEIENVTAKLKGQKIDKSKTKRKKDGVFYTPKYITKYIVDNTVGKLCEEKKAELGIIGEQYTKGRRNRKKDIIKKLEAALREYKHWLLNITICDPACGSGAFLNQALEFLIAEHAYIDELKAQLFGSSFVFRDMSNDILEKNIFGVDINDESVEIAKLSLWLRTAKRGRKLTSLNDNIKCGNSLIDDPEVAGEKAFNWQQEFPKIFKEKEKKAFHITWVTHNARVSQRMIDYKVKKGDRFWLEDEYEVVVARTIKSVIEEDGLNVMAYNSCGDHVHLLLICEEVEIPNIVRKLKGKSSQKIKEYLQIPKEEKFTLWAQKYSTTYVESEKQLRNTIAYIQNNRLKHKLHSNMGLQPLVTSDAMQQGYDDAFRIQYKGGFDVVIGNPPYVDIKGLNNKLIKSLFKIYKTTENRINLYSIFIEKGYELVKNNGYLSFINPNSILVNSSYTKIRKLLLDDITSIVKLPDEVFEDATVETIIFEFRKNASCSEVKSIVYQKNEKINYIDDTRTKFILKDDWKQTDSWNYNIYVTPEQLNILKKIPLNTVQLQDVADFTLGITPYDKYKGHSSKLIKSKGFHSTFKESNDYKPLISGANISRYYVSKDISEYIKYGEWLGAPREERFFTSPRILVRQIVSGDPSRIYAGYTDKSLYYTQIGFGIIPKKETVSVKSLLALINSTLINFFHKYSFLDLEKELFQKILIANCKKFPVHKTFLDKPNYFDQIIDKMLDLKKEISEHCKSFSGFLKSKLRSIILTKKLSEWHELEFTEFLKELEKARKKATKENKTDYTKLSLSEEAEWMQYFNEQKRKVQELERRIEQTDKEIDQKVYQLYGLTDEEIEIVEKS